MSNIIESLKTAVKSQTKESAPKKSDYELTQEELANIYFTSSQKSRNPELPMVIKVIERPGAASVVPWIIASAAFLITAFSLFSTERVFLDIKIIDEKHPFFTGAPLLPPGAEPKEAAPKAEEREYYGEAEKVFLDDVTFDGASKLNSTFDRSSMTLVNSSVAPFARATVRFEAPKNLKNGKVVFYAKGSRGGENLGVALKDRGNVLAFEKGKVYPFPRKLTHDWQRAEVPVKNTLQAFDPSQVASVRFEFGSNADNRPGDTVFVKDIQIIPGQS